MKIPIDKLLEDSKTWNEVDPLDINQQVDQSNADDSWNRLIAKRNKPKKRMWYAYAASISLVLVALAGIYSQSFNDRLIEIAATDSMVAHLMPDSSTVWVKPGSVLSYRESFGAKNRELNLDGIGFFEVTKNKELPFTISSTESTVQVLGTSFLYETNGSPRVQVFTGIVKFENNQSGKSEKLIKGQTATIVGDGSFDFSPFDQNSISWKTGKLIFEDEDLKQVLEVISQFYQVRLSADDLPSISITATFDNLSLEEVIDLLNEIADIEIKVE